MSTHYDDTRWQSYMSATATITWARRLMSYDQVPEAFQPVFPEYEEHFPYTLLVPAFRPTLFLRGNRKIICLYENHFVLLETVRNEIKTSSGMFTDVLYLERGMILLQSWLEIVTLSGTLSIRFNSANDPLFEPVIERMRQGMSGSHPDDVASGEDKPGAAKLDYLRIVNLKYMNYGKRSIRSDDSVIGVVYQPERCIQEFGLFNRPVFRRYTTDHLSILTEKELILIKEEKRVKTGREGMDYGGVFTYIPRCQIDGISFIPDAENSNCIMEVTLPGDTRLASEYSLANEELQLLQESLG